MPANAPIDLALLAQLPNIPLRAKYLVQGFLSGCHRSPMKGNSVEFTEYRAYQSGDEPRRVDWRFFGRSDRLCVKVFEEETQLRVFLFMDSSASMKYASGKNAFTKLEYSKTTLAALAFLASRQGDSFGVAHLGDEMEHFLPARSRNGHLKAVFARLEAPPRYRRTRIAASLLSLAELLPKRSIVIIASDFYDDLPALETAFGRLRYDGHDLIALQVLDPIEIEFNDIHGVLVDVETQQQMQTSSHEMRESYLERFGQFQRGLSDAVGHRGGDFIALRTDRSPLEALSAYLAHREQKL
ncbi:MAG: DUF58 domain-containing protein [Chthoniobacteraceae bacterium]